MDIKDFHKQLSALQDTPPMPALFVGHGTPMNALEDNSFTHNWNRVTNTIPNPTAIVCISAHWETKGTYVTAMENPQTIHDFYGFPRELFAQNYPAKGNPQLADTIINKSTDMQILADTTWGLDHGSWSVLKHMYPQANVPVLQISIDKTKDMRWHYEFAQTLAYLRTKGVLMLGSGNIIHNLRMMRVEGDDFNAEYGFDWAYEIEEMIVNTLRNNDIDRLINYRQLHKDIQFAIPTPEHYIPFLYMLGMRDKSSNLDIFNDTIVAGSLDMLSLVIND